MSQTKVKKERAIFIKYCQLIKEHGRLARNLNKSFFYDEVGKTFFVSGQYAGRVIRKNLGNQSIIKEIEADTELMETLKELDMITKAE